MTSVRVNYARVRRVAEKLLANQTKPPVDLQKIVDALGAEVRMLELAADISGLLFREEGRRLIIVNQDHGAVRQRFSIAHEIAHLALHKGEAVHVDQGFRINLRSPRSATAEDAEEIEANAFAANLLMPAAWLRREPAYSSIELDDENEIGSLAEKYQVSTQAMLIRLATLLRPDR